ncbi:hypothetical protein [Nocardia acidivorans]|uniref:hypothetical protein n=1 Tax=Nocardia acidivorans TaxID=404580 RepID=UPI0008336A23|nr:hypothetical protein [Nocardia acidivorans]
MSRAEARRITCATFTATERALLGRFAGDVADVIASPEYTIEGFRHSRGGGGGRGFEFQFTRTAIEGTWHEFIPDRWHGNGEPYRWRYGRLLAQASVTYGRLTRWVESLPATVREQVSTWSRRHPVDTSDYRALSVLLADLLREPVPVPIAEREPVDLLELLELTNA